MSTNIDGNSPGNKRVSRLFPFTTDSDPLSPARKLSANVVRGSRSAAGTPS